MKWPNLSPVDNLKSVPSPSQTKLRIPSNPDLVAAANQVLQLISHKTLHNCSFNNRLVYKSHGVSAHCTTARNLGSSTIGLQPNPQQSHIYY